ncbi:MAG TPA: 2-succinyl-5-enolpyruvyl-6-hydroxy-3-cyclohexene-1-carboxylic-acid synthase [Bacteroidia bacterium]|jgi:2-succinyl-5-enolpyruvyl-6-hydroxy-3-cyclohexene-1-carboxylate synthase|nr:2-succinyl-5-enolpyruvyl-6-hydroxy-3-cyclohexene-1-carboxylic-acid synthase [Bacteroidia bacterium]
MSSNKPIVNAIVELASKKGMRHAIISSGSRNAPIVISLHAQKKIECLSIIDERSAGFFALGIAQQTGSPVGLVCTSGSAVLNYAPAIVEAYYQKIPLVILTADRPTEWIDQDDGQTIKQHGIFSPYIKASFTLPADATHEDEMWYTERAVSEAFNIAKEKGNEGPVHINIPLREPLYGESDNVNKNLKSIDIASVSKKLSDESEKAILTDWQKAGKKMVICGLHKPDAKLNTLLSKLANDGSVVVMTETTSNMFDEKFICSIDGYFETLTEKEKQEFKPEILITLGGPVTTKRFKAYLRKFKPEQHWHISASSSHIDTYKSLTKLLPVDEKEFFASLVNSKSGKKSVYADNTRKLHAKALKQMDAYCKQIPFSDLKVFQSILKHLPKKSDVQLGNSTPIRYANLFDISVNDNSYYSNRGVSGIDGSVSTAAGAAHGSKRMTTLITGDLAFFYDSNGLWNKHLPENLRIIVINNAGGGIFRIIDSKDTPLLEEYFEAVHDMKVEPFAKAYNVPYDSASNEKELEKTLSQFYKSQRGRPAILEIFTPHKTNSEVLLGYFKSLKTKA